MDRPTIPLQPPIVALTSHPPGQTVVTLDVGGTDRLTLTLTPWADAYIDLYHLAAEVKRKISVYKPPPEELPR